MNDVEVKLTPRNEDSEFLEKRNLKIEGNWIEKGPPPPLKS